MEYGSDPVNEKFSQRRDGYSGTTLSTFTTVFFHFLPLDLSPSWIQMSSLKIFNLNLVNIRIVKQGYKLLRHDRNPIFTYDEQIISSGKL